MKHQALEWLRKEEGFREHGYLDSRGVPTWGYGFTSITRDEAEQMLESRVILCFKEVNALLAREQISLDEYRKAILVDMCYQLGIAGLSKFKKMIAALRDMDYDKAADEMLDSQWHVQTPVRCELLAKRMRL